MASDVAGSSSKRYSDPGSSVHSLVSAGMATLAEINLIHLAIRSAVTALCLQFITSSNSTQFSQWLPPTPPTTTTTLSKNYPPHTLPPTSTPLPPSSPAHMSTSPQTRPSVSGTTLLSPPFPLLIRHRRRKIDWHIMPLMCGTSRPSLSRASSSTSSPVMYLYVHLSLLSPHLSHPPQASPSWTRPPSAKQRSSASSMSHPFPPYLPLNIVSPGRVHT